MKRKSKDNGKKYIMSYRETQTHNLNLDSYALCSQSYWDSDGQIIRKKVQSETNTYGKPSAHKFFKRKFELEALV